MGTFAPEGHQMEGNFLSGSMMPGASYGFLGMQGNVHMNQGSMIHPPMHDSFSMPGNHLQESDHQAGVPIMSYNKGEVVKISLSDDDEPNEDGVDDQNDTGKGKKGPQWHRMKWSNTAVRLLVTAVSYLGEDATSECGGRRKSGAILQKKGKWSAISEVMTKRGYPVTPQQCEDKFNDLNKRYKKLTDILGRGTSCKVVENPALLDRMNNLSEKLKDDARKILCSKHLFYEEMCSYHNCNRLNLPDDPELQRSLHVALQSRDEHDKKRGSHEDLDEVDQRDDIDDEEDDEEDQKGKASFFPKRMKLGVNHEMTSGYQNCTSHFQTQGLAADISQVFSEGSKSTLVQQQCNSYQLQLEEKRLHIQAQMLELEKQRFKWQRFSKKKDRELNMTRMENEQMKLENERLSLELRKKERELDLTLNKTH
ncbi:hypothetical protein Cni_G19954 [Canna indica]|uniref:Myb/SANT-like DNA-binding domain-containing protein n=1 Tax=Canna indica TaxID=4628 RepID=A0AAQ3KSL1_9LILI|nr:hypothetical protein Cni_G19954 [Canna indica]